MARLRSVALAAVALHLAALVLVATCQEDSGNRRDAPWRSPGPGGLPEAWHAGPHCPTTIGSCPGSWGLMAVWACISPLTGAGGAQLASVEQNDLLEAFFQDINVFRLCAPPLMEGVQCNCTQPPGAPRQCDVTAL